MGESTKIEWADHTWNPWWGCTRVSAACAHCYAATWAERWGVGWGASAVPREFGDAHWRQPLAWSAKAKRDGVRRRVFCASMADVFEARDNERGPTLDRLRARLWELIEQTDGLDWLLLTKRPENVLEMIPASWRAGLPSNVWVGATVENQEQADRRIPHLLRVPARVRFLSCEPALSFINICGGLFTQPPVGEPDESPEAGGMWRGPCALGAAGLSWVIAGGESGPGARPMHPQWARGLRDQCTTAGVPFHFKQWGDWAPLPSDEPRRLDDWLVHPDGRHLAQRPIGPDVARMRRVGKRTAGRLLDGRTWDEVPHA